MSALTRPRPLSRYNPLENPGGLYNRLQYCLQKYPAQFEDVLHVATTAAKLPQIYNEAERARVAGADDWGVFLAKHEDDLSHVFPWDKYLPWISKELSRMTQGPYEAAVGFLLGSFKRVFEYVRKGGIDVNKLKLADVIESVQETQVEPPPQGEIVYTYADGWTIQRLTTKEQLNQEGELLQHCVGSYYNQVSEGATEIFSLRGPDGMPHVTLELDYKKRVSQIQAKGNQFPEKHVSRLREAMREVFDNDVLGRLLLHEDMQGKDLHGADLEGADLRDADLRGADLSAADLEGADLRDADLRGADLEGADLRGADLSGADLRGASLSDAHLYGASLSDAHLYGASLSGANLSAADLRGANLEGADLSGANLSRADLYGANLYGADLSDADLSGVRYNVHTRWPVNFVPPPPSR